MAVLLRRLALSAAFAGAVALGGLEDATDLLQVGVEQGQPERTVASSYSTFKHSEAAGKASEHVGVYDALKSTLAGWGSLSHSSHILDYLKAKDFSPSLLDGGCLYLPSNAAWSEFYNIIERPYPPLFADLVANSFYPNCTRSALSGSRQAECPGGRMKVGSRCVEVKKAGVTEHAGVNVQVFETDWHIGLPSQWTYHIMQITSKAESKANTTSFVLPKDKCSKSWKLPAVSESKKLVVPTQFIVCSALPFHKGVKRDMLKNQARWLNTAYGGRSTYTNMDWENDGHDIPQVDMQIQFDLMKPDCTPTFADDCWRIEFVADKECAQSAFSNSAFAGRHNKDPHGLYTVVFVGGDKSGILGMAEFPQLTLEGNKELLVRVSTTGLRGFSTDADNAELHLTKDYDEGDTLVHEAGHSLGLFHTFEGGCKLDGDQIADTPMEKYPVYTCKRSNTCGKDDPIHNFMDYTPDTCMNGFTETQKRRVWCVFENYRPSLFSKSIRATGDASHTSQTAEVSASPGESVSVPVNGSSVTINVHVH